MYLVGAFAGVLFDFFAWGPFNALLTEETTKETTHSKSSLVRALPLVSCSLAFENHSNLGHKTLKGRSGEWFR
jgi:hypothetical protein